MDAKHLMRLHFRATVSYRPNLLLCNRRYGSPQWKRQFTSSPCRRHTQQDNPPFPIISTCPNPTCEYTKTPSIPEELPINHERPLNGTMAAYSQQLVVCTGTSEWASRIEWDERETTWSTFVKGVKSLLGRNGRFADPYNNVLVTTSSFAPRRTSSPDTASALLFPSFKYLPRIPVRVGNPSQGNTDLSTFIRAFLLPVSLHPMHSQLSEDVKKSLNRCPELQSFFPEAVDIKHSPTILICGHRSRDQRCGIMGPALLRQFHNILLQRGFTLNDSVSEISDQENHANLALISHIGGHQFAGNVIIYIPPQMTVRAENQAETPHPLAGKGIWYGRVAPENVEGIVQETILNGRVVASHFRGGITEDSKLIDIPNIKGHIEWQPIAVDRT